MNLKELREKAGVTQWDLAKVLGFSTPQFISNVERSRCRLPVKHWKKAAKVLKVKPEVFLKAELKHTEKVLRKALGVN